METLLLFVLLSSHNNNPHSIILKARDFLSYVNMSLRSTISLKIRATFWALYVDEAPYLESSLFFLLWSY